MNDKKKKYNVLYADPAWEYGSGGPRGGRFGPLDYRTMPTKEIAALPVRELAEDTAALFLWATSPFLEDALTVGRAWGFRYIRLDKVWSKKTKNGNRHGVVGPWGMTDAEFLLLFTRGKGMNKLQAASNQWTIVEAEFPGRHSEKPAIFRQMIEERFPDARRLELFARKVHDGWDAWGDEVDGPIAWAGGE